MTYIILDSFHREGYFSTKITSLGVNLCLLEEGEDGELEYLIK